MFEGARGPNAPLVGVSPADFAASAATPALCIDLGAFERNLREMQAAASGAGVGLRPHMKGHKSRQIALRQVEQGAIGLSCATAKEAETAAAAGVRSILVTTPVVSPMVLTRLVSIQRSGIEVILVVDTVNAADRIAGAVESGPPIGVLVDVNVGQNRTGVSDATDVVALARHISGARQLTFRGVQAYYGHLQHIAELDERRRRVEEQLGRLRRVLDALAFDNNAAEIVSGGGTGTAELDLASGLFTEIQPGSYIFLDSQYGAVERHAIPLTSSLTVLSRVTSTAVPGQVVIDAGTKAISTDLPSVRIASPGFDGVTHKFMGDEHSVLVFAPGARRPAVGDLVSLTATHCDPTVNLHDRFHVMDNGQLVDIWPIEARGY